MEHTLKIWPSYFQAVLDGRKNFEVRNNYDRGFQAGDIVILEEYIPNITPSLARTGRRIEKVITYVTNFKQQDDYVVFGLGDIPEKQWIQAKENN